jgi:hypothetical protein
MAIKFSSTDALTKVQVEEIKNDWVDHMDFSTLGAVDYLELTVLKALGNKGALDKGESVLSIVYRNIVAQFPHPENPDKLDHMPFRWSHVLNIIDDTLSASNYWSTTLTDPAVSDSFYKILNAIKNKIYRGTFDELAVDYKSYDDENDYNIILVNVDNSLGLSKEGLNASVVEISYLLGEMNAKRGINCRNFLILSANIPNIWNIKDSPLFHTIDYLGLTALYVNTRKSLVPYGINDMEVFKFGA